MPMNIALDGPVGAGKSTISDMVAQRLGILHLDTGAMYRAAGLLALRTGCNLEDEAACTRLVENMKLSVAYKDGLQQTLLEGEDVSGSIRTLPPRGTLAVTDSDRTVLSCLAAKLPVVGYEHDGCRLSAPEIIQSLAEFTVGDYRERAGGKPFGFGMMAGFLWTDIRIELVGGLRREEGLEGAGAAVDIILHRTAAVILEVILLHAEAEADAGNVDGFLPDAPIGGGDLKKTVREEGIVHRH